MHARFLPQFLLDNLMNVQFVAMISTLIKSLETLSGLNRSSDIRGTVVCLNQNAGLCSKDSRFTLKCFR